MTIYKNKDIETNINERGVDLGDINVNFYTEDNGTASVRIKIKNQQGYPINFDNTDMLPRLDLYAQDGSIFTNESVVIVLADQGLIQYKVSDYVIKHQGKIDCKLFLSNGTDSVHVANFYFVIKDSGITGAIGKEIHVDILEDMVRNVMTDNAMGLLDDDYKEKINQDVVDYIANNPDKYKGSKGDEGKRGPQGERGAQGYKGKPFTFEDFTPEQLNSLRTYIVPGEKETKIVDKGIEDSFIVYPPNGEDLRLYPSSIGDEYYHSSTIKNTTPTNSVNANSSFKIDTGGYLFYAVKTKDGLAPGKKFSIKVEVESKDSKILLECGFLDSSGEVIGSVYTPFSQISDNTYGLEEYVIPQEASAIQFRVDARQASGTSSIKSFYLFEGKSTKEVIVSSDEEVLRNILKEIDKIKYTNTNDSDEQFNIPVFTPLNFTEKNHLLNNKIFTDGKGSFKTRIDMNDYKLKGGKTYYIDVKKGNNDNDGLNKDAPMQSFRDLLPKVSDNDTIIVAEGNYLRDRGVLFPRPFNKSVNIIGENNKVNIVMADEPTWVKTSGRINVYNFSRSATDRVVDLDNDRELTKVNSIDSVDTTPNSWFTDGTIVYVNADNMPNVNIVPVMSANNLQTTSLASNIYFENINIIGGKNCVELNLNKNNSAFFNNCSFNYSTDYNGLAIIGGKNIVLNHCTANNNAMDGFNYHIGSDGSKPFIIEIDCTGLENGDDKGKAGVKSNNGTTIHDGLKGIRINGLYGRNDGGNVADVNEGTETWNLSCTAFESYQGKDFQTSSGSHMWLDNCVAYGSENSINSSDSVSKIYTRLGNYQNKLILGEEIKY